MKLISCFNERNQTVRSKGLLLALDANPQKRIEQEDQILKFPGGYVQTARCSTGEHWAHVVTFNGDRNDELFVESKTRRITKVKVDGRPLLLSNCEALCKVSLKIAPLPPQHAAAEVAIQKNGWGISFPGGYLMLEETASGLRFRVRVFSRVEETRLDRAWPVATIEQFPATHLQELEVDLSDPLAA